MAWPTTRRLVAPRAGTHSATRGGKRKLIVLRWGKAEASIPLATAFGKVKMPTLVLRNVPDDLYQRLKQTAAEHRRSMTQEAIVSLRTALEGREQQPPRPSLEDTIEWLRREVWTLPMLDQRSDDEILGYNDHGHFD